jgi:dCMP deaminase
MRIAKELSALSTCDRKYVGALIVRQGRCITWGYNGAPPSMPHCDENNHGFGDLTADTLDLGCRNATHAEANALAFSARHGISVAGGTLYVTVSPCLDCARLLIAAGIYLVWYDEEYRDPSGRELLQEAGVTCLPAS